MKRAFLVVGIIASVAAPAWMYFIKDVYRNRPTRDFDPPVVKK